MAFCEYLWNFKCKSDDIWWVNSGEGESDQINFNFLFRAL